MAKSKIPVGRWAIRRLLSDAKEIENDFHIAHRYWAIYQSGNGWDSTTDNRQRLRDLLGDTFEAHTFNQLLQASIDGCILAITRSIAPFNRSNPNTASYGSIVKLWEYDATKIAFLERSHRTFSKNFDKKHVERFLWDQIHGMDKLKSDYESFLPGQTAQSLRQFRDSFIAHRLIDKPERMPRYIEVEQALSKITDLFGHLNLGLFCSTYFAKGLNRIEREYADCFWDDLEVGLSERRREKARGWLWRHRNYARLLRYDTG